MNRINHILLPACLALAGAAAAITVDPFAWMNVDYGFSEDYYGEGNGRDQLGTAQLALGTKATYENLAFIGVIGADRLSILGEGPVIQIRDAFIDWSAIGGTGLGMSFGAQPFLFGLKPNGYPGDRSLVPSLEFVPLGPQGFAASRQAGPSVKVRYDFMDKATLTAGVFDNSLSNVSLPGDTADNGSSILDNQFIGLRLHDAGLGGIYGYAGMERAYVGGTVDESKFVFDGGIGFKRALFDLSGEYISIAEEIAGTGDRETLLIGEATVTPPGRFSAYADYSMALELELQTWRFGAAIKSHDILTWVLEYSLNMPDAGDNAQGVVGRAHLAF